MPEGKTCPEPVDLIDREPAQWLVEACRLHSKPVSMPDGDIVCEWCTYMDPKRPDDNRAIWTPEHLAREVHKAMIRVVLNL